MLPAVGRLLASLLALALGSLGPGAGPARAQDVPLIRFGHGFAAEEQVWLMAARKDLTPHQGKQYRLRLIRYPGPEERFQAYRAGRLEAGTAPAISLLVARAQGLPVKAVASVCLEAAGPRWFSTTFMVRDGSPIRTVRDLKGGRIAVVGARSATDLWARAAVMAAGLAPDRDVTFVSMAFPAMGPAVRAGSVALGTFVEPFHTAERRKGGLRPLFTAVDALGFDHELLDVWMSEAFLKARPAAARAFLADYAAVTRYYVASPEAARRDLVRAGYVQIPLSTYLKIADWKREPTARIDVASLRRLAAFMRDRLGWLQQPVDVDRLVDLGFLPGPAPAGAPAPVPSAP